MEDSLLETPLPKSPTLREVPCWDPECGLLTARDKTKRYRLPAERQRTILSAFQEEGWPTRIDAPLPEGVVNKAVSTFDPNAVPVAATCSRAKGACRNASRPATGASES